LEKIGPNHRLFQANYKDFDRCLAQLGIKEIDGMLLDLGVSSFQLDREERGFSYQNDAPLDMRMNQSSGITAEELVNTWSEQELAEIIWSYGEERWAKRIAQFICEARQHTPLRTTGQLVDVIKAAIPKGARQGGPHPAKRTFQAIRIAVNDELGVLQEVLDKVVDYLKPRGRLVIISFHSLEDRIVKKSLQQQTKACICPPGLPVCQCGHVPRLKVLTKKPVLPTREEVEGNPRARSAKLRAAEKI
jgi:16S rRNA (cytosine1402-N4)-methyltransferase